MDVVRYADTAGDNADYPIPRFICARLHDQFLNADKPFDLSCASNWPEIPPARPDRPLRRIGNCNRLGAVAALRHRGRMSCNISRLKILKQSAAFWD
jgi:hypothetical protein